MVDLSDYFGKDEIVSRYSRQQAIEDGMLVDITENAKAIGFKFPVACTSAVHAVLERTKTKHDDLLKVLLTIIRISKTPGRRIDFTFADEPMYSLVGPGDTPEPVITIMLISED